MCSLDVRREHWGEKFCGGLDRVQLECIIHFPTKYGFSAILLNIFLNHPGRSKSADPMDHFDYA